VVLTGLTGVGQWTRGLVFRFVLGSEGCVLVPRSSGTPVATWAWPTWVVSLKDRLGDQRGGSEWEPIKILLGGD
jgi:hypothetical protein